MSRCCDEKRPAAAGDVESVDWLTADAPAESDRPYAPVTTSLPDPELLPEAPPMHRRVPRLLAWALREPKAALVHFFTFTALKFAALAALAPLVLSGPTYATETCRLAVVARLLVAFFALRLGPVMFMRYLLYQHALVFSVAQKVSLASVTIARLEFRRARGAVLALPVLLIAAAGYLYAYGAEGADCVCGRTAAGPFAGAAFGLDVALGCLAAALPAAYWILYVYGADPVEEASILEMTKKQRQHKHTSS